MRQFFLAVAVVLGAMVTPSFASYSVIESVAPSSDTSVVPYTKFKLNNGLTVIVHEDHSDPIAHIEVMYHVGSARETIGKSGFAHFFEHMMFQGSKHVPYNAHFRIITEAGGKMNGSASRDRTNYYQTVPRNQLETVLWMEADRMGFFLDGVNQEKFEIQRDTVKNEKEQNYDSRPYGLSGEYLYQVHYPNGHPYSWLTIGKVEDLDRVTVDDLKTFFSQWYSPNNAVVVIAGDVDTDDTIRLVDRYFSEIKSGPPVNRPSPWVPLLPATQYVSYEDPLIELPQLTLVFPTPPRHHTDEPALDCVAMVLGSGINSRLYQALVKTRLASSVEAYNYTSELAGEFVVTVTPFAGTSLSTIERIVRQELENIQSTPVSEADLVRFKSGYQMGVMRRLESVEDKAGTLAFDEILTGNPGFLALESRRYLSVSTSDVERVYNRYIAGAPATVLSVVPKGQGALAAGHSRQSGATVKVPQGTVVTVDRSIRPTAGPAPLPNELPIWRRQVNGMPVLGTTDQSSDVIEFQLTFPGGGALAEQLGLPNGITPFLTEMLMEDTEFRSVESLNFELEKLGSTMSISPEDEAIIVSVRGLKTRVDETINCVNERLRFPAFSQADFDRVRRQAQEKIKEDAADSDRIADRAVLALFYGKNHPFWGGSSRVSDALAGITIDHLRRAHDALIKTNQASLSVVGNVNPEDIDRLFSKLQFNGRVIPLTIQRPGAPAHTTEIHLIHLPGATQAELRIVAEGPRYDVTGNFLLAQLFNFPIGGNFNSKINLQLREVRGYSYGAYSYFEGGYFPGNWEVVSAVKGSTVGDSIRDCLAIISDVSTAGISSEEVAYLKRSILQREALKYETFKQKLEVLSRIQKFSLSPDFLQERARFINAVDRDSINAVGQNIFAQPMKIIVIGDAEKIRPQLKDLGVAVTEHPLSDFIW